MQVSVNLGVRVSASDAAPAWFPRRRTAGRDRRFPARVRDVLNVESGYNGRPPADEGADAATVAGWMREAETERVAAQAKLRSVTGQQTMSQDEITAIVTALGDLVKVLADADPADKIRRRVGNTKRAGFEIPARTSCA